MRPTFSTIYWVKNFATGENSTYDSGNPNFDSAILKKKNDAGFNVYRSVNSFIGGNRKKENLGQIRACFVDIDYPELSEGGASDEEIAGRAGFLSKKFQDCVLPVIRRVREEYGIVPSELNVTQKGFHILYGYDPDCAYVGIEIHEEVNAKLGDLFGGDKNARDVCRVYKVPGYADWKNGYKGKIRPLNYGVPRPGNGDANPSGLITAETIAGKFGIPYAERDSDALERAYEKWKLSLQQREKNRDDLNRYDSLEFVRKLREHFEGMLRWSGKMPYPKERVEEALRLLDIIPSQMDRSKDFHFPESDGKTPTSGLLLKYADGIYRICDYSKHARSGNYNFLKYWILPALGILKGEEGEHMNRILHSAIGFGLNSVPAKKTPMNAKLFHDYFHGRIRFGGIPSPDPKGKNPLGAILDVPSMAKTYFALFSYVYDRITIGSKVPFQGSEGGYFIEYLDFFSFAFPNLDSDSKRKHHKKNLIPVLSLLSQMEVLFEDESAGTVQWKKILSVRFPQILHSKGKKDGFFIVPLEERSFSFGTRQAMFDLRTVSFEDTFLSTKVTDLLLYAECMSLGIRHDFTLSAKYAYEFLGLTGTPKSMENTLRKHLSRITKFGIFRSYSLSKGKIILSKKKPGKREKAVEGDE